LSKNIYDLKSELDEFHIQFRSKKIEKQETDGENISLQQIIEGKNMELGRGKTENKSLKEKNLKLKNLLKNSENKYETFKKENANIELSIRNLLKDIEKIQEDKLNFERNLKETDFETKRNEGLFAQINQSAKKVNS
jgi:hypothetical protein